MSQAALATTRCFLDASPKKEALMAYLSPEVKSVFQSLPMPSADLTQGVPPLEDELSKVHPTWIAPLLRTLPEGEIALFLGCLPSEHVEELKALLLFADPVPTLSELAKPFLCRTLMEMLSEVERMPSACLPAHPLNELLHFDREKLLSFIDLLSMHDLAAEVRTIIGAAKLKSIYDALTKPQCFLLQEIVHAKEPFLFKHSVLKGWSGEAEQLQALLRERGLNRLAKALAALHPDLLWHLSRHLEAQYGEKLVTLSSALGDLRTNERLVKQALSLLKMLEGGRL